MDLPDQIEKSFPEMEKLFVEKSRRAFINCPEEDLCLYHLGPGSWIRNQYLQTTPPDEQDRVSSLVIRRFHAYMRLQHASIQKEGDRS